MTENEIATIIVDTAFHIHRDLGPGLFETVYERILEVELTKRGLSVLSLNTEMSGEKSAEFLRHLRRIAASIGCAGIAGTRQVGGYVLPGSQPAGDPTGA